MTGRRTRFRPGWAATVAAVVLVGATVALGTWQLQRADEKRALQDGFIASQGGLARRAAELSRSAADRFVRVRLDGRYGERQFLVDNRTFEGRAGYLVVTPFHDASGDAFLVARGWTPAPASRDRLPAIPVPAGRHRVEAVVWPDTGLPPLLAEDDWSAGWPKRVQRLDMGRLGPAAAVDYPFALRLEPGQPGALQPLPVDAGFRPERHDGYAVQWYALGALVGVLWLILGIRRGR
jgi:surfeit locus 1 family protein